MLKPASKKLIEAALGVKPPRAKKSRPKTDIDLLKLMENCSGHFYSLFALLKRIVLDKFFKLTSIKRPAKTSLEEVFSSTANCTSFLKDIR